MFVSAQNLTRVQHRDLLQSRDRKGAVAVIALAALSLLSLGCSRLDMQDQPKFKAQGTNDFFADARDGRPELEGTIARGQLNEDTAYYEGKDVTGNDIAAFPVAVDKAFLERGRQRYDIYCSPCHGRLGNGLGMVVQRGFKQPPSYHIERLRNAPVGHLFEVITNGYGAMLNYSQQIQVRDRWAIVAYIRALQYSQNASANDLPTEARAQLPAPGTAVSGEMKNAMQAEPMAPVDNDFVNFPSEPATPAGVPGSMGAGAASSYNSGQPEKK
jgi:mono/diheme cytochrome c family protein